MKHILRFEENKIGPKENDYLVVKIKQPKGLFTDWIPMYIIEYINNNVSRFLRYENNRFSSIIVINDIRYQIYTDDIEYWSENKEDAEVYLQSKKYNL